MINQQLLTPRRVWVNCPSKSQPYHDIHAKVGIAIYGEKGNKARVYFTNGPLIPKFIDPIFLIPAHSTNSDHSSYCFCKSQK